MHAPKQKHKDFLVKYEQNQGKARMTEVLNKNTKY